MGEFQINAVFHPMCQNNTNAGVVPLTFSMEPLPGVCSPVCPGSVRYRQRPQLLGGCLAISHDCLFQPVRQLFQCVIQFRKIDHASSFFPQRKLGAELPVSHIVHAGHGIGFSIQLHPVFLVNLVCVQEYQLRLPAGADLCGLGERNIQISGGNVEQPAKRAHRFFPSRLLEFIQHGPRHSKLPAMIFDGLRERISVLNLSHGITLPAQYRSRRDAQRPQGAASKRRCPPVSGRKPVPCCFPP
nr:MAG TPA: hypothetical protein [Caudoviricetes sp.]